MVVTSLFLILEYTFYMVLFFYFPLPAGLLAAQAALRGSLRAGGVVGFVINGAILPRLSGNCDRPMDASQVGL